MASVTLWEFCEPGDVVLFKPDSLVGWLIATKTWSKDAAHSEVVSRISRAGRLVETFTARGGASQGEDARNGVGFYTDLCRPERSTRVTWILRPISIITFNSLKAHIWADQEAVGQGYDYLGLSAFLNIKLGSAVRMICSEACRRYLRAGDFDPFHSTVDSDAVAPATFLYSPLFDHHRVTGGLVNLDREE